MEEEEEDEPAPPSHFNAEHLCFPELSAAPKADVTVPFPRDGAPGRAQGWNGALPALLGKVLSAVGVFCSISCLCSAIN